MVIASQEDLVFSAVLPSCLSYLLHSLSNSQNCLLFQEKGSEQEMYPRLLSAFCFTHGCSLIYCLSD